MASIFIDGKIPEMTKAQKKISSLSWKPNSARLKIQNSHSVVSVVFRSEKAQAEFDAREAVKSAARAERRAIGIAKSAATRAAKKSK